MDLHLVAVRLELVVRSSQAQARREVTVRDAAGALGASPDAPAIREVALLAARDLLGVQLRYVAWIAVNDRGAIYPTDLLGPHGEMDRADAGVDDAIQQVDEIGDRCGAGTHCGSCRPTIWVLLATYVAPEQVEPAA